MATPTDHLFTAGPEALEEKVFAAEKNIASVRCAVVAFNSLVYIFFIDKTFTLHWLAYFIIALSSAYSLFVILYKPYKRHPIFLTSYSTYGTDALFITLWILATGVFDSPFYVLFYISIIAVSFRFSASTIWFTAFLYSFCYIVLLAVMNELNTHIVEVTVRVGYIFCIAFLGKMISGETLLQMQQKRQMQQLALEASEAEEKLRTQTQLYQNLLNAQSEMGEGVSIIESDRFIYVNDAFCKIFGYTENELMALPSTTMILADEEREVIEKRHYHKYYEGVTAQGGQTIAKRKDGSFVFITYSFKLMKGKEKKQLFILIRDITDEVKSKEALLQKSIDLEHSQELDKKKDEFIGVASHEMKTPLTSIHGYAQLLDQVLSHHMIDPDTARTYIRKTQHQIDRLSRLINDLLDVSRIQAGQLSYNMEKFDLGQLVEDVCEGIQLTVKSCKIQRDNCFSAFIVGDKSRIEQVLVNLITNALKYSQKVEQIVIKMEQRDNQVVVSVKDFGMGIPQEELDKIFQRFYRISATEKKASGLGIGLFISAEIVERHNGRIWAESEYGKGATFYFTLPVSETVISV